MDIGAYEAKTHFSQLLERVEKGKRGRPVALLVPAASFPHRPVAEVIAEIRELRKGVCLDGLKIKDMIREGRP
jgi:prevent-host-death family protein